MIEATISYVPSPSSRKPPITLSNCLALLQIASIGNTLAKATSMLHRAHNEHCLLFKLPVEILHQILEFVPDHCSKRWRDFRPIWRNTLMDSSMLIPVTHTCHRLREVALAHPHVWTTFQASIENLLLTQQMAEWSKRVPLNAVGSDINMLKELSPDTRSFGSIHLYDINAIGFHCLRTILERLSSPALHSFSLSIDETDNWDLEHDTLPLTPEYAPNLRELTIEYDEALVDKGFPRLTHLALIDVSGHNSHARFISFVRECPRLESIFLSGFAFKFNQEEDVPNNRLSIPLLCLRHVTLHNFWLGCLKYYATLLQPPVRGSFIQILAYHSRAEDLAFPLSFLLPTHSDGPDPEAQNRTCIGVHPASPTKPDYAISLTSIAARSTRRLAVWDHELSRQGIGSPHKWLSRVLSHHTTSVSAPGSTSLLAADEVWLYGVSTTTFPRTAGAPLAHFFSATRVVIALDRRLHYNDAPTLHLLPSTRDPSCGPISITTLRIVHGFSAHGESPDEPSEFDPADPATVDACRLPLGQLIQDLQSGGYGYLKHFVLQVTSHMSVDGKELDELKDAGRFETFKFERIEEFPEMPGHSDPARWGCERYPGSLW